MPIIGMTDSRQQFRQFAQFGKLHKGAPKPDGRPGADLNYFRVEFNPQYEYLRPLFVQLYGEKPEVFRWVLLIGETPDEAFDAWYKEYTSNRVLQRKCDGQQQHYWLGSDGAYHSEKTACIKPQCSCTRKGVMNLMLLELCSSAKVFGTFMLETGSINDILNVSAVVSRVYNQYGGIKHIPMVFGRRTEEITAPEMKDRKPTGRRITVKKSIFYMHEEPHFIETQAIPALVSAVASPLIPATVPQQDEHRFMTREEFLNELAKMDIDEAYSKTLIKQLGLLSVKDQDDKFDIWYKAIVEHVNSLPLTPEEIVDGEIVVE